jgi:hypothetical protein
VTVNAVGVEFSEVQSEQKYNRGTNWHQVVRMEDHQLVIFHLSHTLQYYDHQPVVVHVRETADVGGAVLVDVSSHQLQQNTARWPI